MKISMQAFVLIAGIGLCAANIEAAESPAQVWSLPAMPDAPPPLVGVDYMASGFVPPKYPEREWREGIPGEVLLEIYIDDTGRITTWKVVRATTPGYAKVVERKLKKPPTFKGVPAGTFSWSFVFCGSNKPPDALDRPGTVWIVSESFGSR